MIHVSVERSDSLQKLIQDLQNRNWKKRFDAGFKLELRASELGKFVETLQAMALNNQSPGKYTAAWLLRQLSKKTTRLWKHKISRLVCPACFAHCRERRIKLLKGNLVRYYACPICGQSDAFLETKKKIFAVLDDRMTAKYIEQHQVIHVNWLLLRAVFDFDKVEIIRATDEDVERFAVQVGNDTDPVRKTRYGQMCCTIASDCELSENTMRILRRVFGQVEIK